LTRVHHARPGKVALEIENVPEIGAAEVVDRLILVTNDEQVSMGRQKTQETILHAIRVLVLVDQHVAETAGGVALSPFRALEELDPPEEQVVEIDAARGFELPLIPLRRDRDVRVEGPRISLREGLVLPGRYRCRHPRNRYRARKTHLRRTRRRSVRRSSS
jgi:hypothetical protein